MAREQIRMDEYLGFGERAAKPRPTVACDHQDNWRFSTVAGLGLKTCDMCGASWCLWEDKDGGVCWVPIDTETDDEQGVPRVVVSEMAQGVRAVSDGEDE